MDKNGNEIKLIIYLDDNGQTKQKHAFIQEDDFWVIINLYDVKTNQYYGEEFKIPKTRVLKIKEVKNDEGSD